MSLVLGLKSKIALLSCGLGILGGASFLTITILSGETIENYLKKADFTVLKNNSSEWRKILENYSLAVKTNQELKFDNFVGDKIENLKKYCEALLNKRSKEEEEKIQKNYKKAFWCVKEQTVEDYLKIEGYQIFKTDESNSEDNSKWDLKVKEHSKQSTTAEKIKIPQLSFSSNDLSTVNENDRNKMKQACKNLKEKKHYETDFKNSKSLVASWCSEIIKKA